MRKTITILVLMFVLCSTLSACKKEKKVGVAPQNKILFTAKQKGSMNIVNLDLKTKSRKVVLNIPINYTNYDNNVIISPDKKKIAFFDLKDREESVSIGTRIYVMNIDGSDIKLISKSIQLSDICYFLFSPDSKTIIIFTDCFEDSGCHSIYLIPIDGSKEEYFTEKDPDYILLECFITHILIPINGKIIEQNIDVLNRLYPETDEYLLNNGKGLGFFSWSTRNFSLLFSFPKEIKNYCWSPDQKFILFSVEEKFWKKLEHWSFYYHDVYLYDVSNKTIVKIIESSLIWFPSLLWLPDSSKFIYFTQNTGLQEINDSALYKYDMKANLSTLIKTSWEFDATDSSIEYLYDNKILFYHNSSEHESTAYSILDIETTKSMDIPYSSQRRIFVVNKNLYIFSQFGFFIFDTRTNTIKTEYKHLGDCQQVTFSPYQEKFYLLNSNKLQIYDMTGNLLHEESLAEFKDNSQIFANYVDGVFTSPEEITYIEYFYNDKTDLFCYNQLTGKTSNLTESLGEVEYFMPSPDYNFIAILSYDSDKESYSIDVMNTSSPYLTKKIVSFDFSKYGSFSNEILDELNADGKLFKNIFWSGDSQYLFFTKCYWTDIGETEGLDSLKRPLSLTLNRVKNDGSGEISLTEPFDVSIEANLSPDSKQIVFVSNYKQVVTMMDIDGTNKKEISTMITTNPCYQPMWSPDGENIVFAYRLSEKNIFEIVIVDKNGKIAKKFHTTFSDTFHLTREFNDLFSSNRFFSPNGKDITYPINTDDPSTEYQVILKNQEQEIRINGKVFDLQWSPDGKQLLLFKCEKYDSQQHQSIVENSLFDYCTNKYVSVFKDVQQIFDACWLPDGKQILYSGTDNKTGQIVFKTSQTDGSNQKLLFTFEENPLERPNSIEMIEKLVWLK